MNPEEASGAALLNQLIQLDFDAVCAYERAIARVDNDVIKRELEMFKSDHERHIVALSDCVRDLGGTPIDLRRDAKGVLLEGLTALRSVAGVEGALKALRTIERQTNRAYAEPLRATLPNAVRGVVEACRSEEQRHWAYIQRVIAQVVWSRRAEPPPERPTI
jgi:rubrerythrin